MGISSAVLQACRAIPVAPRSPSTKDFTPLSSLPIRNSAPHHSCFDLATKRCKKRVNVKPVERLQFYVAGAVVDDRTAAVHDCEEGSSLRDSANAGASQEYDGDSRVGEEGNENKGGQSLDEGGMTRVCDKLIEVFMVDKPSPADWRKLLAFSRGWSDIRPHFFRRCQERADGENDPGKKQNLLRLRRKLKEVDDDVQRHYELLEVVRNAPVEINEIVSRRRKDFTNEFFVHLHAVAESYYDNPAEHNALAKLGNMCLDAVQAYDAATESAEAVSAAELKFQDILSSSSLDVACKKIDDLAAKNQLDSALLLMITKAWSAAKDTNLTEEEAKDIMYHLYLKSMQNLEKQVPKETRIIRHLLTMEDPKEQLSALEDAFTPGDNPDDLYTYFFSPNARMNNDLRNFLTEFTRIAVYRTPEQLYTRIKSVVDAYHLSEKGTLVGEARDLMSPRTIQKLEDLKKLLEKEFM